MKNWKKLSHEEIKARVFGALKQNVNYYNQNIIGLPASHLDDRVFYSNAPILADAPFLSTMIHNPNHIGCHTLGESESFFKGTQDIERELIKICAEEIMQGDADQQDGYVAAGGTEANMQAIWIYRNYFIQEHKAGLNEIVILCSEDAHYSAQKASNVLMVDLQLVKVKENRSISETEVAAAVTEAQAAGKKYFIVMANMMTTMFGSVDNVKAYSEVLNSKSLPFKLHIDGAYGGFYYPFANKNHELDFRNSEVDSITMDAHKMLQAPYGTGIFLCRKNLIHYANTKAGYVQGEDYTLIGSRSGANAIAVWMILMTYGPHAWFEKMLILKNRADWMEQQLKDKKIAYFREPYSNILSMKAEYINAQVAEKYGVIPDNHHSPTWYKVVIMDHVTIENLSLFLDEV